MHNEKNGNVIAHSDSGHYIALSNCPNNLYAISILKLP